MNGRALTQTAASVDLPLRVLIADDNRDVRVLVRMTLEQQGFRVVGEATSGAEAIALAEAYQPDVLLLDVTMPGMDGLEALLELRRLAPDLPIVMHSGFSESSLSDQCLRAGAVAYTEKGIDPLRLARVLRDAAAGVISGAPPSPRPGVEVQARTTVAALPRPMRDPQRLIELDRAAVPLAAVLFAAVFMMRLTVWSDSHAAAITVLHIVPIALLAARFGMRGGLVGTAVAAALLGVTVIVTDSQLGLLGIATRLVAFLVTGLAIGAFADRVQRLLAHQKRAAAAIVSANRQLAEALERAQANVEALETANDDLRQFGYIVSHDLAEPLRSMSGFSSLLADDYADRLDERGLQYLGFIGDGASRMQELIDDLRVYTLAGQQDLVCEPVDLEAVLRDVVHGLSATIDERSAVIEADDLPVVMGDRSLLALVLQNLVSNAVKFNESEEPRVRLKRTAAADGWVAVDISDNGIGIPEEHADRVFGLFSRLHTRQQYPGTGLGLGLVKRIVERHGGRIEIVPATVGTTFRLTLAADEALEKEGSP